MCGREPEGGDRQMRVNQYSMHFLEIKRVRNGWGISERGRWADVSIRQSVRQKC